MTLNDITTADERSICEAELLVYDSERQL